MEQETIKDLDKLIEQKTNDLRELKGRKQLLLGLDKKLH